MAGALHKAMVYLGLTEEVERYDEEYEDNYRRDDSERGARDDDRRENGAARGGSTAVRNDEAREDSVPEFATSPERREEPRQIAAVEEPTPMRRPVALATAPSLDEDDAKPRHAAVTPLPRRVPVAEVVNDVEVTGVHRITTIHPRTYNEAKKVGEAFREGTPVIMNLSDLDDADAKRLVDFAAGLVFGLSGSIERVTNKVFLLSPSDVEVTSSDSASAAATRSALFDQS